MAESFEPWDRQPKETSRSYALFAHFRDMGPFERTYGKVARQFGLSVRTVGELGQMHDWMARSALWDAENERVKRQAQIKELEGMARRQVLAGQLFMSKGLKRIQAMSDEEVAVMSIWEATRLTEVGVRLERLGRGEPVDLDQQPMINQQNIFIGGARSDLPIHEVLRRNPTRVGPVVALLAELAERLPELNGDGANGSMILDGTVATEIEELTRDDSENGNDG